MRCFYHHCPLKNLFLTGLRGYPRITKTIMTVKKCVPFIDAMSVGYTILNHMDICIWQTKEGEVRQQWVNEKHKKHMQRWPPYRTTSSKTNPWLSY